MGSENEIDARVSAGRTLVEERIERFAAEFGRVESDWKYDGSRVTQADLELSKSLESSFQDHFPDDQFLSEETDPNAPSIPIESEYAWLVDPIDGTNNFARGIPACAISVALLQDGVPVYGIIYDHMSRNLIHGGRNRDVWVGDTKAKLSSEKPSPQSIIGAQHCETGRGEEDDRALQARFKIRNLGSSAIQLGYVAIGWMDGVLAHRVNSWDIAAGVALLAEAGGRISYFDTNPFPLKEFNVSNPPFSYMAGSPEILGEMLTATGRG